MRLLRESWLATVFAAVTILTLVSYDLGIGALAKAAFDVALLGIMYVGMLTQTRRLIKLETQSSTRDEVLSELRKTVRIRLPIAAFIPAMAIVQRLVFDR